MALQGTRQLGVLPGDGGLAPRNRARADGGTIHSTIQDAVDHASTRVDIGPGTFTETVEVNTDGLSIYGSGDATHVGNRDGNAFWVRSADVAIKALAVSSDPNGATGYPAIYADPDVSEHLVVHDITVLDSANLGIVAYGDWSDIQNCRFRKVGTHAVRLRGNGCRVTDCRFRYQVARSGIYVTGRDAIVSDNYLRFIGDADGGHYPAIWIEANDVTCNGNRLVQPQRDGIFTNADGTILTGNSVTGAVQTAIDTTNATNTFAAGNNPVV